MPVTAVTDLHPNLRARHNEMLQCFKLRPSPKNEWPLCACGRGMSNQHRQNVVQPAEEAKLSAVQAAKRHVGEPDQSVCTAFAPSFHTHLLPTCSARWRTPHLGSFPCCPAATPTQICETAHRACVSCGHSSMCCDMAWHRHEQELQPQPQYQYPACTAPIWQRLLLRTCSTANLDASCCGLSECWQSCSRHMAGLLYSGHAATAAALLFACTRLSIAFHRGVSS